jgi:hypothetical protein
MSGSVEKTVCPASTENAQEPAQTTSCATASAAPQDDSIAFGGAEEVNLVSSTYQKILAVSANLLILIELTIAMFFAAKAGDDFQPVFLKIFFSMLIPTLVAWIIAKKLLTRHEMRQAKK